MVSPNPLRLQGRDLGVALERVCMSPGSIAVLIILDVCLPGVLLLMTPRWNGTVGWVGGPTRAVTVVYVGLVFIRLLADAVYGSYRDLPNAGLFILTALLAVVSLVMCGLFSVCFFKRLTDVPVYPLPALGRAACGLAIGVVLFFIWAVPFPFVPALIMVFPSAIGTILTICLTARLTDR
jgi:hypothetical protein